MKTLRVRFVVAGGALLSAASSFAQTTSTGSPAIDVSGAVATINNQLSSIGLIGTAILAIVTSVAAIAWVRRPIH